MVYLIGSAPTSQSMRLEVQIWVLKERPTSQVPLGSDCGGKRFVGTRADLETMFFHDVMNVVHYDVTIQGMAKIQLKPLMPVHLVWMVG